MLQRVTSSAPLRLLMTTDAVGGVLTYTTDVAARLAELGHHVTIAVIGPQAKRGIRAGRALGLRTVTLPGQLDWLAANDREIECTQDGIARAARGHDAVIVHAPALVPHVCVCPVVTNIHSCAATWWQAVHGTEQPHQLQWQAHATADGLRRADRVIVPSHAFGRAVSRTYELVEPVTIIHNGRRLSVPHCRDACGENSIFASGRVWDAGKNMALLDRIGSSVPWPIRIAGAIQGPGDQRSSHHFSRAHMLGQLDADALFNHLASRPIFVSPALYEPFGLGVLEAATHSCALVLSDIPSFRELWDGAAVFADPRDDGSFSRAILQLIESPARRRQLGRMARRRASLYSMETCADRVLSVVQSTLQPAAAEFA